MKIPASPPTALRTHMCGELTAGHAGSTVELGGWVHRSRDLGGLKFIDLRDRTGIVQVAFDPAFTAADALTAAAAAGPECVITVQGTVSLRPPEVRNADLSTGDIEIQAKSMTIVGRAATPAIPVAAGRGEKLPSEELRLRYRYLDLRRPELLGNLVLRHVLLQEARRFLSSRSFLEVETPILTRPTPEGARDYLVPSRVHAGEFYALPQSPQLYKQLLMVAGFDRYFQIARCFRDEDLRADRQPEFTQIDIEASFINRDDIFALCEDMLVALWSAAGVDGIRTPFLRLSHADALERFGTDRPDMRYGMELFDATELFRNGELAFARAAIDKGGRVRGLVAPGGSGFSRKQISELEEIAKGAGASGLMYFRIGASGAVEGSVAKYLTAEQATALNVSAADLALLVAGDDRTTGAALDRVRQEVARRLSLIPPDSHAFLWVTDFPLFASDAATGSITPEHHPFTAPHPSDMSMLAEKPLGVRALAYDAVYNGLELASGSIRISDPQLQEKIFSILGVDAEEAAGRFGFLLEGLRSGAPPHGGIAFGFDRIVMLLAGAVSLRDVIAFPKTTAARALFEDAPTRVTSDDLDALHIELSESKA